MRPNPNLRLGHRKTTRLSTRPKASILRLRDGIDGAGNSTHSEWTGKFDGKDYPVKGDLNQDSRSYKRNGIHELDFQVKKGTNVTTTGRIVVSDDGKSRTVTSRGTDAQGKKYTSTAVYDQQ
jgi:hypothetical protein